MASPYDQSLLADAPVATKAELQEGYNVDLLQPTRKPAPPATPPTVSRSNTNTDPEAAQPKRGYVPTSPPAKVPFWRTRKGIFALAVLAIVIIAAVVGGAVGGTRKHHNNDAASPSSSASSTASGTNSAGAGADSPTSTTESPTSTSAAVATDAGTASTTTHPPGGNLHFATSTAAAAQLGVATDR
ncbi:hypothetical protein PLICRDRAFT_40431 [Plicaturopsis crispa FD-325 SS-3]|nr:hypothetical protein PLICRDRAFT_40431 [Plicaturopsis crispa FD-325 SS-3]